MGYCGRTKTSMFFWTRLIELFNLAALSANSIFDGPPNISKNLTIFMTLWYFIIPKLAPFWPKLAGICMVFARIFQWIKVDKLSSKRSNKVNKATIYPSIHWDGKSTGIYLSISGESLELVLFDLHFEMALWVQAACWNARASGARAAAHLDQKLQAEQGDGCGCG